MRQNHPPFAGMNALPLLSACRLGAEVSTKHIEEIRPDAKCGSKYEYDNEFGADARRKIGLSLIMCRRQMHVGKRARRHRQIDGSLKQAVVHRRSRPAHAALIKTADAKALPASMPD